MTSAENEIIKREKRGIFSFNKISYKSSFITPNFALILMSKDGLDRQ